MDDLEWINHTCGLTQAKYIVIYETELDYNYRDSSDHRCFKELKWAKECYAQRQKGMCYPRIIRSTLIECKRIKDEKSKECN